MAKIKFNDNHSYNGARLRGQVYDDLTTEDIKFLSTLKSGFNSEIPLIEEVKEETSKTESKGKNQ